MAETKKMRVTLTPAEVKEKGTQLASLVVEGQRAEKEHRAANREYNNRKKERDEEIARLAVDRSTETEEREFECERRANIKLGQYEYHKLDGTGIIPAATRKMTKDELTAEQQLSLEGLGGASSSKAGSNGKLKLVKSEDEGGKLVKTDANKRKGKGKGPTKAKPESQPTA